ATKPQPNGQMPDLRGLSLRKALAMASVHKLKINVQGSGIVQSQSIAPGTKIYPGAACVVEASL
ncbi:MAG: PASTA domain-containing protein, partial [Candidatus Cloacimonetes bacterium]|nr:PASTA domain-containing protein [Candidatus Cloacimonadota bacterium]